MYAALCTTALSFTRWVCERNDASVNESAWTSGFQLTLGKNFVIGSSKRKAPRAARSEMANPVNDLLVDARYQSVFSSARSRSRRPFRRISTGLCARPL